MKKSLLAAAAVCLLSMLGSAQAATLSGAFTVIAVNAENRTSAQSQATIENFTAAAQDAYDGVAGFTYGFFEYTGDIDFATNAGTSTTIKSWLETGKNGAVNGLAPVFGGKKLSKGNINNGTATTTFFAFVSNFLTGKSDVSVTHDDGVAIFDGETRVGGFVGPNSVRTTLVPGFNGGQMTILYVATNSDPSILKVDVAAVPLPAALPLLAVGLGGLGALRLRRKAA